MTPLLTELRKQGVLSSLDVEFARALAFMNPSTRPELLLAAALASRDTREGHVCVDLARLASRPVTTPDGAPVEGFSYPSLSAWLEALSGNPLVSRTEAPAPLIFRAPSRLYLFRYYEHERTLARCLRERAARTYDPPAPQALRAGLLRLFGPPEPHAPDLQRAAAMLAVVQRLSVISGGPGTGKTSTVVRLAALVLEQQRTQNPRPRTLLLAPTGKAAARLVDAVKRAKKNLDLGSLAGLIPEEASTIHRALAPIRGSGTQFRHNRERPLFAHLVIVDEASMVDVALMRRLVEAVPPSAHLILLGDADQLASVEAGAVLSDVCGDASATYSRDVAARVRAAFGEPLPESTVTVKNASIDDCVVRLTKSYRFDDESPIGRLSSAVRRGDVEGALAPLSANRDGAARWVPLAPEAHLGRDLARLARRGYEPALKSEGPIEALTRLESFRILCAHRRGAAGVEEANDFIERVLAEAGLISKTAVQYEGRPILITRNDYQIGLFNGDQGILWRDGGAVRAFFLGVDGAVRAIAPSRLPAHETAYATSIHKSQGSEYDEVAVLLPEPSSPLLTRELLYTAVSRARSRVSLFATEESLRRAVGRQVARATGLREALRAGTIPAG